MGLKFVSGVGRYLSHPLSYRRWVKGFRKGCVFDTGREEVAWAESGRRGGSVWPR